eukprot:gene3125-2107_t
MLSALHNRSIQTPPPQSKPTNPTLITCKTKGSPHNHNILFPCKYTRQPQSSSHTIRPRAQAANLPKQTANLPTIIAPTPLRKTKTSRKHRKQRNYNTPRRLPAYQNPQNIPNQLAIPELMPTTQSAPLQTKYATLVLSNTKPTQHRNPSSKHLNHPAKQPTYTSSAKLNTTTTTQTESRNPEGVCLENIMKQQTCIHQHTNIIAANYNKYNPNTTQTEKQPKHIIQQPILGPTFHLKLKYNLKSHNHSSKHMQNPVLAKSAKDLKSATYFYHAAGNQEIKSKYLKIHNAYTQNQQPLPISWLLRWLLPEQLKYHANPPLASSIALPDPQSASSTEPLRNLHPKYVTINDNRKTKKQHLKPTNNINHKPKTQLTHKLTVH